MLPIKERILTLLRSHNSPQEIGRLVVPLFTGSLVLGGGLALICYAAVTFIIKGYRMRALKFGIFLAATLALCAGMSGAGERSLEKIVYSLSPVGKSTYNDFGAAKLDGRDVRLATFRTQAVGFDDTEKIYSDPQTFLPIRVERDISMWLKKEYIVEEYDQKNFRLTVKKYSGKKVIQTIVFKEKGPIYNAVLLPFSIRREPKIDIGWKKNICIPANFEVKLAEIEEIKVSGVTYKTFHFTSNPNKFEIWITCDEARVPVKITGTGGLGYAMEMQSREVR